MNENTAEQPACKLNGRLLEESQAAWFGLAAQIARRHDTLETYHEAVSRMRLFTAIELPPDMLLRLDRLICALRPEALINWSPLDNLHITAKFIGEWPKARLAELDAALRLLAGRVPFEIEIAELGWFPTERSPRVFWAGVSGGKPLLDLARDTDGECSVLGIPKEERTFSPHLTLARIKHQVPLEPLRRKVQELGRVSLGSFVATSFTLYKSEPGSNASVYSKLHEYEFEPAAAAAKI
jgi:2'-5' RNA ligase